MAIDNFMAQKLLSRPSVLAAYCGFTNMPLLVCDPDTFSDQVWVFENEELLKQFSAPYTERKIPLKGITLKKESYTGFFTFLYSIGVNELSYMAEGYISKIPLEQLAKKPDYSKIPEPARPVENPELQLTGLYFLQEFSRPVPNEEKENLQQLDEEFSVNIVRARYVMAVDLKDGPGTVNEKISKRQYNVPIIKVNNGDSFQPIFTDMIEFNKFRANKKLNAIAVPFGALKQFLVKDTKGFMLNPAGFHAVMPPQLMDALIKKFPEEAAKAMADAQKMVQDAVKLQQAIAARNKLGTKPGSQHPKVTAMPTAGSKHKKN